MTDPTNPLATDGFEFVEFTAPTAAGVAQLHALFVLLGFTHAQAAGAINSTFPSRYRYSGAIITSDLAWLVGAAFAPLAALFIASRFGVGYVGLYLLSGAVGTLMALGINRSLEMRDD